MSVAVPPDRPSAASARSRVGRALRELAAEGPLTVRVRGHCMAPDLPDGAVVEVSRARFYWPGDVLALRAADGRLLVHRLLGYRPHRGAWHLVTQADAASLPDAPARPEQLLGRLVGGECAPRLLAVPLADRLRACGKLLLFALRRMPGAARRRVARRAAR